MKILENKQVLNIYYYIIIIFNFIIILSGMHPCDRRRTIDLQRKDYPRIDFSKIISDKDPIYSSYTFREPETHCAARGKEFLEYLFTLDEKEVIVVTHSGLVF